MRVEKVSIYWYWWTKIGFTIFIQSLDFKRNYQSLLIVSFELIY